MSEDFGAAVLDAAVAEPAVDTSAAIDTTTAEPTNDSEMEVLDSSSENAEESTTEGKESETHKSDGSERTAQERQAFKDAAAQKSGAGKESVSILEQREALKVLRDLDPKYARIVKEMHGAVERYSALKPLLPGGVNELKSYLSEVGAKNVSEARTMHADNATFRESVAGTDELLYKADPQLSANVYEDMKSSGNEKNYGTVVANFVNHLKETDPNAYYDSVMKPHMVDSLGGEVGLPSALNALDQALKAGDAAAAGKTLQSMIKWWNTLFDENSESGRISKEKQEWNQEREAATKVETEKSTKAYQNDVATTADKSNNEVLGKHFGAFLKMPFFKDFPRDTKVLIGNQIKSDFYAALKADKTYQSTMNSYWKQAPTAETKAKMLAYHNAKLEAVSNDVVTRSIQKMYPGYARGGSAAGKQAAMTAKKATDSRASAQSVSTNKPLYVPQRPENLIREDLKLAGGRTLSSSDLITLQIAGKGYVRTADGKSVRFITWRKS